MISQLAPLLELKEDGMERPGQNPGAFSLARNPYT